MRTFLDVPDCFMSLGSSSLAKPLTDSCRTIFVCVLCHDLCLFADVLTPILCLLWILRIFCHLSCMCLLCRLRRLCRLCRYLCRVHDLRRSCRFSPGLALPPFPRYFTSFGVLPDLFFIFYNDVLHLKQELFQNYTGTHTMFRNSW